MSDVKEYSASGTVKQSKIDVYVRNVSEFTQARTPYKLNRYIDVWCSIDLQPFNFFTKSDMQCFFDKNCSNMQLPSRKTLNECGLDDVYDIFKQKVLDEINDINCICVMFHGWSSEKGLSYVGIRVAYIRKD